MQKQKIKNDSVYLRDEASKIGKNKKLTADWKGPYKIISINKPNATI